MLIQVSMSVPPHEELMNPIGILSFWYNSRAKLLQKSEMRKDIVIELSYKGFG